MNASRCGVARIAGTSRALRAPRAPSISFSTLARACGAITPSDLVTLLRGHKLRTTGAARGYQAARVQAIDFLVEGIPFAPEKVTRPHEREVIARMARSRPRLPRWARAVRPSTRGPAWMLGGVRVSMFPDVVIDGGRSNGAAKLSFTKEPLAPGVGSAMASLLYHWRANVLRLPKTAKSHCLVFEPRLPWVHHPSDDVERDVLRAEAACSIIKALWTYV